MHACMCACLRAPRALVRAGGRAGHPGQQARQQAVGLFQRPTAAGVLRRRAAVEAVRARAAHRRPAAGARGSLAFLAGRRPRDDGRAGGRRRGGGAAGRGLHALARRVEAAQARRVHAQAGAHDDVAEPAGRARARGTRHPGTRLLCKFGSHMSHDCGPQSCNMTVYKYGPPGLYGSMWLYGSARLVWVHVAVWVRMACMGPCG
eukprot:365053-Chlamydomonas_euryale.AAC.32